MSSMSESLTSDRAVPIRLSRLPAPFREYGEICWGNQLCDKPTADSPAILQP